MADLRIERLRRLAAHVEQSPPTEKRDALVSAVRERIVTLDAGAWKLDSWGRRPHDREVLDRQIPAGLLRE